MGFLGTAGCRLHEVKTAISKLKHELFNGQTYGINIVSSPDLPEREMELINIFLEEGITVIEVAAFVTISPALVKYRLHGLKSTQSEEKPQVNNRIIAKVSRPEAVQAFLSPAPESVVKLLLEDKQISSEQAYLSQFVPMADDITVEADSGGHTDRRNLSVILPAIIRIRDKFEMQYKTPYKVHIGCGGGLGSPEAIASALVMGADYVVTGSINQCTIEAGTSEQVKEMLSEICIQDTAYAPAGDMFEVGASVQVMKRGVLFPSRARKLYELWNSHGSIEDIDTKILRQLEEKYFCRNIDEVYEETRNYYLRVNPQVITSAEQHSKKRMALIFRWYFIYSTRLALSGDLSGKVNYQVHTGPAMGSFNSWAEGSKFERWDRRHVDDIAISLLNGASECLSKFN